MEAKKAWDTLRATALSYPEAWEDHPWGHLVVKVKTKIFLFMNGEPKGVSISAKLPKSSHDALVLPFSTPTGYGMGKHGWVSAEFGADADVPIDILLDWLDESYRAIAPKKLASLPRPTPTSSRAKSSPRGGSKIAIKRPKEAAAKTTKKRPTLSVKAMKKKSARR
jgi:predicted DNA-binding protein (MmcQ/YjbR family)